MKKHLGGIAVGLLLVGCGGAEVDDTSPGAEPQVVSVEQGICEGWNSGARRCTARCANVGNGFWFYVGDYPAIQYGGCGTASDAFCRQNFGTYATANCWSY